MAAWVPDTAQWVRAQCERFRSKKSAVSNVRFRPIADIPWVLHVASMTGYEDVDATIAAWANGNVKMLFNEWAGAPARFAYLPGLRPHECFQIWVQPPSAGRIVVSAASVDTDDDSEHHRTWDGRVENLAMMLDHATATVREWANRCSVNGS